MQMCSGEPKSRPSGDVAAASPGQLWAHADLAYPQLAPVPVASALLRVRQPTAAHGHCLVRSIDQLRCRLRRAHLILGFKQRLIADRDTRDLTR